MLACSGVVNPAINAGTIPEYSALPWLLTNVIGRLGRRCGCIAQRRSSRAWLWPPPARINASEANAGLNSPELLIKRLPLVFFNDVHGSGESDW